MSGDIRKFFGGMSSGPATKKKRDLEPTPDRDEDENEMTFASDEMLVEDNSEDLDEDSFNFLSGEVEEDKDRDVTDVAEYDIGEVLLKDFDSNGQQNIKLKSKHVEEVVNNLESDVRYKIMTNHFKATKNFNLPNLPI